MQGSVAQIAKNNDVFSSIADACAAMSDAGDRDEILKALLKGAACQLDLAQLYTVRKQTLKGRFALDADMQLIGITDQQLELNDGSVANRSVTHGLIYLGPVPAEDSCAAICQPAVLAKQGLVIVPVTLGKRTVCLLMGHPRGQISRSLRDDMAQLTYQASVGLAGLMGRGGAAKAEAAKAEAAKAEAAASAVSTVTDAGAGLGAQEAAKEETPLVDPSLVDPLPAEPSVAAGTDRASDTFGGSQSSVLGAPMDLSSAPGQGSSQGSSQESSQGSSDAQAPRGTRGTNQWEPWAALGVSQVQSAEDVEEPAPSVESEAPLKTQPGVGAQEAAKGVTPGAAAVDSAPPSPAPSFSGDVAAAIEPAVPAEPAGSAGGVSEAVEPVPLVRKKHSPGRGTSPAPQPAVEAVEEAVPLTRVKKKRGKKKRGAAAKRRATAAQQHAKQQAKPQAKPAQDPDPQTSSGIHQKPSEAPAPDSRAYERLALVVEVHHASEHNFFTGFMEDISEGGLFVATHAILDLGTEMEITFTLPGMVASCTARCRVRWVREYKPNAPDCVPGMGLSFHDLDEPARAAIGRFLKQRQPIFFED